MVAKCTTHAESRTGRDRRFHLRLRWLLLLVPAASLGALAYAQGGRPGAPAKPKTAVTAFTADGQKWAWLESAGSETTLYTGGPGEQPRALGKGKDWKEVALVNGAAWVLSRKGERGAIEPVTPAPGEAAGGLQDLAAPGALRCVDGNLYWIETSPPDPLILPSVTAAGPKARLHRSAPGKAPEKLAEWPAALPAGAGDVIG
ncbi:MAG TPA: hypothetical protein VFU47_10460, partial [Armatimonadota bacterium]|nr:hypothetical protein [Armatimonadota bacterium]